MDHALILLAANHSAGSLHHSGEPRVQIGAVIGIQGLDDRVRCARIVVWVAFSLFRLATPLCVVVEPRGKTLLECFILGTETGQSEGGDEGPDQTRAGQIDPFAEGATQHREADALSLGREALNEAGALRFRHGAGLAPLGNLRRQLLQGAGDLFQIYQGFPNLGIGYAQTLDEQFRKYLSLNGHKGGVYISKVVPGASAAAADLREGDVILSIGGNEIDSRGNYDHPVWGMLVVLDRMNKIYRMFMKTEMIWRS